MQKKKLTVSFEQYDDINKLSPDERNLLFDAMNAAKSAYAPYSDFKVGAAALLENNIVVKGNNQENAAYPSGLCAERVALFAASAQHPGIKIKAIAVAAFKGNETETRPASPCGACRQVMTEYEHLYKQDIRLIMMDSGNKIIVAQNVTSLLPFLFSPDSLK
jgi:cytidine deaminase